MSQNRRTTFDQAQAQRAKQSKARMSQQSAAYSAPYPSLMKSHNPKKGTNVSDAPVKQFKDMSEAEQRDWKRQHLGRQPLVIPHANKQFADMTPEEKAEFELAIGIIRPVRRPEAERGR